MAERYHNRLWPELREEIIADAQLYMALEQIPEQATLRKLVAERMVANMRKALKASPTPPSEAKPTKAPEASSKTPPR